MDANSPAAGSAASRGNDFQDEHIIELTADIVSAYVGHNALSAADLPRVIGQVHAALSGLVTTAPVEQAVELKPAVPVKKSITPDYLICLEDGKQFKSLKRHLKTEYGMSPEDYRAKWGLPSDYPMVAPNYSEARSRLAKSIGLGRKPTAPTASRRGRKPQAA